MKYTLPSDQQFDALKKVFWEWALTTHCYRPATRRNELKDTMGERSSVLGSVLAVETACLRGCESPVCSVRFPQTGLQIEPRRFCSGRCRQQASIIRRAAALLVPLG